MEENMQEKLEEIAMMIIANSGHLKYTLLQLSFILCVF